MSMNLNNEEVLQMSMLAYLDLEKVVDNDAIVGLTIAELSNQAERYTSSGNIIPTNGGIDSQGFVDLLADMAKNPNLASLKITDYENDNIKEGNEKTFTGFVGIALEDTSGNSILSFCGSEGGSQQEAENAPSPFLVKDWIEDYSFGSTKHESVEKAVSFAARN